MPRAGKVICVLIIAVLGVEFLSGQANAEQQGYRSGSKTGSTVFLHIIDDAPHTGCLIYSTNALDTIDGYFIQAGLYDCATSTCIDNCSDCPAGRHAFGEISHNGMYTCHHGGGWLVGVSLGVEVLETTTPGTWRGYVHGSALAVTPGFAHDPEIRVWEEWNWGPPCDAQTSTKVEFSNWEYRTGTTWNYMTSPSSYRNPPPPNNCLIPGLYSVYTHGFFVVK
jgi:hypothetical protein